MDMKRIRQGLALGVLLVGCVVALLAFQRPQPAALESAILPPRAFRNWLYETTRTASGAKTEIPLDRFAGRGRGRTTATKKAKREREAYLKTYQGLEPQIKELDAKMKETATWDHGRGDGRSADGQERATAGLEAKRLALDQAIAKAKSKWRASQDPVDRANKELVYGRAREWNKDKYLGGADHFVPVGDAHKQLAGGGYGHRYSVVDWLSGDRR